jgi:hypothetical protein
LEFSRLRIRDLVELGFALETVVQDVCFCVWGCQFGNKAKLRLDYCTEQSDGVSANLSWAEERTKALEDIKKLDPGDRLGLYASLIRMNSALFESVRGWDSWLRNPSFIETFTETELKEIYAQFKSICVKFLEEDVKWTGMKEKTAPMSKTPRADRSEAERRYA